MGKIAVIGSINIDYFVETDFIPKSGETVTARNMFLKYGGKGANQAIAASRLGAEVSMFGSIGNVEDNKSLLEHFKEERINTDSLNIVTDRTTGSAFIQLHDDDNRITVIPGANEFTDVEYCKEILPELLTYDVFVFQLEIPMESLEYLIPILHRHNKIIILDPAPAMALSDEIIEKVTFLTPNEHEVELITNHGIDADELLINHPNKLIVTLGSDGVKYFDGDNIIHTPARTVEAIDTTGAGDTFAGAFAASIANGGTIQEGIELGIVASSLAVTKKGAQEGMPYLKEVTKIMKKGMVM